MKVQIELLLIFTIAVMLFLWAVWYRLSLRRAKKKSLNLDNEKYKTRRSAEVEGRDTNIAKTSGSVPRPAKSSERSSVPTTDTNVSGKDSGGFRSARARIRRIKSRK